jgi:hypothetical protein
MLDLKKLSSVEKNNKKMNLLLKKAKSFVKVMKVNKKSMIKNSKVFKAKLVLKAKKIKTFKKN